MRGELGLEIPFLTIATLATLLIFAMHQVHVILAVGLIGLYVAYLWISSTRDAEEPDLIGAAELIGSLPTLARRVVVVLLFIYSAGIILVAAEPFVEGLIETGNALRNRRVPPHPVDRAPCVGVSRDHSRCAVQPESPSRRRADRTDLLAGQSAYAASRAA